MAVERIDTAAVVRRLIDGHTQADIAAAIGVTQTAISYWASGQRTPGLDDLANLLDATGGLWADILPTSTAGSFTAGYRRGYRDCQAEIANFALSRSPAKTPNEGSGEAQP